MHEQSLTAIPSTTQLIIDLCKEEKKKTSESRTGYTREKQYITNRTLLFIEGTESFPLGFRLGCCVPKTQFDLASQIKSNDLKGFLWKASTLCELCACCVNVSTVPVL